jgi:anti-sigma factor RsiW
MIGMPWWRRRADQRLLNCKQVARVLQAYLNGDLDEFDAWRVTAHLEDCRRCGLEAATIREIKRALAGRYEPSPASVARLRAFCVDLLQGESETAGDRSPRP